MMKKSALKWAVLLNLFLGSPVWAQWAVISDKLEEQDIQAVMIDPARPSILYAAAQQHLYKTSDSGVSWKRIMSLRGVNKEIHSIYTDVAKPPVLYVATSDGVKKSIDEGKRWTKFYVGPAGSGNVYAMAPGENPGELWLATDKGVVRVLDSTGAHLKTLPGMPDIPVYSILTERKPVFAAYAATDRGIYQYQSASWKIAHPQSRIESVPSTSLEQFNIEELVAPKTFSSMIFLKKDPGRILAATPQGLLESPEGKNWSEFKGQTFQAGSVRALAPSSETFYAATDSGVYRWDADSALLRPVSEGLENQEVRALAYSASGDFLLAATKKGLYRWSHPDFRVESVLSPEIKLITRDQARDYLARFNQEPSIRQIQDAAVRYAEVHPDKIAQWRRAASKKALLPTVSVGGGVDTNENVDLDRGGTGDADHFIIGPNERSFDWSVGMSWNLGDLIWNDDQTSIDSRSKLMAELRDDVLSEVTHLYYERRRLQVEMQMSATSDLPILVEKEIRLDELTAGIDALTGGYFSSESKRKAP